MPVSRKLRSQKGFTLVELLIVVAIIGVLSTIGVPTFRKMIQKAKKSEAKVNLGGLYTAEQAFYAEYGIFGNRIESVGFETDGQNLIYKIGFMGTDCGVVAGAPTTAAATSPLSTAMLAAFPDYAGSAVTVTGNISLTQCTPPTAAPTAPNVIPATGADPNAFLAYAVGVISPGVSGINPGATKTDIWSMNNERKLLNIQDGVGKKP